MTHDARPDLEMGAVVLAGGRSSRMGRSKALLDWHGSTTLRRITGILQRVASPVVVVHAEGQTLPALPGAELVVDASPGRGPLEGMAAGMRALRGRCRCVYVSGTDVPLLHPQLVLSLARALDTHQAVTPLDGGRVHPLATVYRIEMLSRIEALLARDDLRVTPLLEGPHVLRLEIGDLPWAASLRNLNTPKEYAQAIAEAEPEIIIEAADDAALDLLGSSRRIVRAATLGRAVAAAPGLSLTLNGEPLCADPTTPLVAGDVITVTSSRRAGDRAAS